MSEEHNDTCKRMPVSLIQIIWLHPSKARVLILSPNTNKQYLRNFKIGMKKKKKKVHW